MKNRPIHENLDTSFVNLSALVKYLRRRQFVGLVKIQLNGYQAEIFLDQANELKVSEHDQLSGRISEGEEALQRILIRAREPGGTINVFQQTENSAEISVEEKVSLENVSDGENSQIESDTFEINNSPSETAAEEFVQAIPKSVSVPEVSKSDVAVKEFEKSQTAAIFAESVLPEKPEFSDINSNNNLVSEQKSTISTQAVSLPDFPFRLSNKVEERAKKVQEISGEEWRTLLNLTVELLGTIDKKLAQANLDFASAFKAVCAEISDDYPFLNPANGTFAYSKGKMKMTEQVNPKIFTASIVEAIRRILEKLEANPKFTELHRETVQTILAVINKREKLYDKFDITYQLKRILGI